MALKKILNYYRVFSHNEGDKTVSPGKIQMTKECRSHSTIM